MLNKDLIEKLKKLGWNTSPYSKPNDDNFYLWNEFEITHTNELNKYLKGRELRKGVKVYLHYKIYPNIKTCKWYIWFNRGYKNLNYNTNINEEDYNEIINLILNDKFLTYSNSYHWLEKLAFKFNTNINRLAEKMNINRSTLYKMVERNTELDNVTIGTIKKLANALNITIDELIEIIERLSN